MTCIVHVAWDKRLGEDHFGLKHPMAPFRVKPAMEGVPRPYARHWPASSGPARPCAASAAAS